MSHSSIVAASPRKKQAAGAQRARGVRGGLTYVENFDSGPGGWQQITDNFAGNQALTVRDSAAISYGPWWVDYNHAPPGAGYLNLLMFLSTRGPFGDREKEIAGRNNFVAGGFPHDFTDAKMTVKVKGELELRGAQVVLLIQGMVDGLCCGWLLTGQPICVGKRWSTQTLHLTPDEKQWTALGVRHDRQDFYNWAPLAKVLANVNVNFHLLLFPVTASPLGPQAPGFDPHRLRAGRDYKLWVSRQPDGYFMLDSIRIRFR